MEESNHITLREDVDMIIEKMMGSDRESGNFPFIPFISFKIFTGFIRN